MYVPGVTSGLKWLVRPGGLLDFFERQQLADCRSRIRLLRERQSVVRATAKQRNPASQHDQLQWLHDDLKRYERIEQIMLRGVSVRPENPNRLDIRALQSDLQDLKALKKSSAHRRNRENIRSISKLYVADKPAPMDESEKLRTAALLESVQAFTLFHARWKKECVARRRQHCWLAPKGEVNVKPYKAWYYLLLLSLYNPFGWVPLVNSKLNRYMANDVKREYDIPANLDEP